MPGWLDFKRAAQYLSMSDRTLRRYLSDSTHRLPAHIVGGKWLFAPEDLDRWVKSFPTPGAAVDRMVETVLRDLGRPPRPPRKDKGGVQS
jgi:excisionase family DNA binding protein